jgi:site-specific recombinase XerD
MKYPPEPLTRAEAEALLACCSRRAPTGIRNRALIAVLWRGGLRISEALDLFPKDLDPIAGTIRVLHGKGDKSRVVGMDPGGWALLRAWLVKREALGFGQDQPVFCTLAGRPVQSAYIRSLMPRLRRRAGIGKRVHAHGLRHTHASELRAEGFDLGVISKQLGHSSIATTARYVDHLNPQAVVDAIRSRTM